MDSTTRTTVDRVLSLQGTLLQAGFEPAGVQAFVLENLDRVDTTPLGVLQEELATRHVNAMLAERRENERRAAEERARDNSLAFR